MNEITPHRSFLSVMRTLLLSTISMTCAALAADKPLAGDSLNELLSSAKSVPMLQALPLPHAVTSFQNQQRELTAVHFNADDMRPFWYPIMGSKGVSLVRMGHPHDPQSHSHHNGVWISHNKVNGLDFWGDHGKPELQGRIVTVAVPREAYSDADDVATMQMTNHWIKASDGSVQLIETRRTEVRSLVQRAGDLSSWLLIIDLEYSAPEGITSTFGPSYFGLVGVRMAKTIGVHDGGGRVLNSEGQLNEAGTFRKPARWCDYSGRITNEVDGFAGITLMNHPSNPQNPTPFHVRDDGWICACLTTEEPALSIEVSAEKKLRLRYALWVHDGVPTRAASEAVWTQFTALPLADLGLVKAKAK